MFSSASVEKSNFDAGFQGNASHTTAFKLSCNLDFAENTVILWSKSDGDQSALRPGDQVIIYMIIYFLQPL